MWLGPPSIIRTMHAFAFGAWWGGLGASGEPDGESDPRARSPANIAERATLPSPAPRPNSTSRRVGAVAIGRRGMGRSSARGSVDVQEGIRVEQHEA